jgi:ParB family chromosome partitioning protein
VPVIVTGPEGDDKAEEIARIINQRAENTYRQGMKSSEHANAAHQLSLLGVSEKDISEQLRLSKPQVRAAKKLAKSETGQAMLDDNVDLDIVTAAKIAEFEDDRYRVNQLLHYLRNGENIDQLIRKFKAKDTHDAAVAKVRAELETQGHRVTDVHVGYHRLAAARYLTDLVDENSEALNVAEHTACPGHALTIEEVLYYKAPDGTLTADLDALPEDERDEAEPAEERLEGVAVCDQANELHPDPNATSRTEAEQLTAEEAEQREAERKEAERADRIRVRAGNKEWDAAEDGRRKFAIKLVQRKTLPTDALEYLTGELLLAQYALKDSFDDGHPLAAEWLGVEPGTSAQPAWDLSPAPRREALRQQAKAVSDNRRLVLLLTVVLAANEKALNRHSWRQDGGCSQRNYLQFLIAQGYAACGTERLAAGLPEDPAELATTTDEEGTTGEEDSRP